MVNSYFAVVFDNVLVTVLKTIKTVKHLTIERLDHTIIKKAINSLCEITAGNTKPSYIGTLYLTTSHFYKTHRLTKCPLVLSLFRQYSTNKHMHFVVISSVQLFNYSNQKYEIYYYSININKRSVNINYCVGQIILNSLAYTPVKIRGGGMFSFQPPPDSVQYRFFGLLITNFVFLSGRNQGNSLKFAKSTPKEGYFLCI